MEDQIKLRAYRYSKGEFLPEEVPVVAEYRLTLRINGNPFVSIACSGKDMELLAIGHLITEGILRNIDEIKKIDFIESAMELNIETRDQEEILERLFRIHSIASGCGGGNNTVFEDHIKTIGKTPHIKASTIISSMKKFLNSSELHNHTGGVHSASLITAEGEPVVFFDEIGRHNAIDKIIGYCCKKGIDLKDKILLSTGRLPSEIIFKAAAVSIPVVATKASPTSLGIETAKKYNIMMIGRVRGSSFYIYHGRENIS